MVEQPGWDSSPGPAVVFVPAIRPSITSAMPMGYGYPSLALVLILLIDAPSPQGHLAAPSPCEAVEANTQFDFWLGTWDLTWGEEGRGTNTVKRILDGCIIEESFEGQMPEGMYRGISMSAYDPKQKQWRQTWVDNRGGYLDFTGQFEDDRMILQRSMEQDGKSLQQRMVWYNISADHLDWRWEKSEDGGATWSAVWAIHYTRRK